MAEGESAPTVSPEAERYTLDVPKLHSLPSEQQDLYLLTFTADLARHVAGLDTKGASAQQAHIKKEVFQILTFASPAPTRVIRNNLGRCIAGIFSIGNRKLLYETINDLVAIVNGGKEKELVTKHAAIHCLGKLLDAAGDSAVSLTPIACTSILKSLKAASNHAGMRAAVYRSLGGTIRGIGGSLDEVIARDIWKSSRSAAASDKSFLVQVNACWCLEQIMRSTQYYDNSSEFEKLQTSLGKAMDSPCKAVRHAAASCLAAVLVKGFSESHDMNNVPKIKKPKKTKKQAKDDDPEEELERVSSPVPSRPIAALSFNLASLLKVLSGQYTKQTTSNRARASLAICYRMVLTALGEGVVERMYGQIANHFFEDLLSHTTLINNRYRQLLTREYVSILLQDVVGDMLGDSAQLNAARFLINDILKDYPQTIKERAEPSKQALTGALSALSALIVRLDAAFGPLSDSCREALLQVLQHPSYTVQVHASRCFRALVTACPQQLLPAVTICMNSVNRELGLLSGSGHRHGPRKCVGLANGLAAILSTSSQHALYSSVDVYARILEQATNLLRSSGGSNLRISSTQVQVAWIMIGGLMSLGHNFVKIHISQFLMLLRNALTPPPSRQDMAQRSMLELSFLAHVRECALGATIAFLHFNSRLLTSDVSKRLAVMLQNTASFSLGLPNNKTTEETSQRLSPSLQLLDLDLMVRRRMFQCYSMLMRYSPSAASEIAQQSNIMPLAMACFADPDNYTPSSMSVSIASSAGSFESIWEVGDNSGFGITGLVNGFDVRSFSWERLSSEDKHWTSREDINARIDRKLRSPTGDALEHDSVMNYLSPAFASRTAQPPATEVVNASISMFAAAFPMQSPKLQHSVLEQLSALLSNAGFHKDPARRSAVSINIITALFLMVKSLQGQGSSRSTIIQSSSAEKLLQDMLRTFAVDPDESVRYMAAETLGRACSVSGTDLTNNEVRHLIDTIVSNREPHVRAGCALALSSIHAHLGGMAAGYHLKNIFGILMSLAADPHPIVHFWALESLCKLADSAGLSFSTFVSSSVGLLGQLYVLDSHNVETAQLAWSNLEMDLATTAVNARCIDSIINVLGPDLQDMVKPREMILTLVRQLQDEEDSDVLIESTRCLEHMSLYAPGHMEFTDYVRRLRADLDSDTPEVRDLALTGLANLMRRDTDEILRIAEPGLEDKLWDLLDAQPDRTVIRGIFTNWLQQTGLAATSGWIQRCSTILTKSKGRYEKPLTAVPKPSAGPDIQDDEVAGFAAAAGTKEEETAAPTSSQELMRWQVRLFTMDLVNELLAMVAKDVAVQEDSEAYASLQRHIADVVKVAFSASTAGVVGLRVRGLKIIDQILKMFGSTPDPDFVEAMLLEQYQAQISSALTPAFAADSSPELAAEAVNVCATFISTGIVTDIDRMGRILKLLVSALETLGKPSEVASIGDLRGLSSNAQVMVRMAVFSAWAGLQISTSDHKYLEQVVKPHVAQLTPLWLASLREYARLRFEPDVSSSPGAALTSNLDSLYAALNRETLLRFYEDAWLRLVEAIASLIDEDSDFVFDALDGKVDQPAVDEHGNVLVTNGDHRRKTDIDYRDEPAAFFFVLFGLAFEALAARPSSNAVVPDSRTLDILQAFKKILQPSVSGTAIYQEVVFSETMELLDRLVLTEGLGVQTVIVEIARNMCLTHPSSRAGQDRSTDEENLSDDIEQLFELTRIIVLVLAGLVPGLAESNRPTRAEISDEAVVLIRVSLEALVDAAEVFPAIIRGDLHSCIFHLFISILGTGSCQATVVPQALPIFRRFINGLLLDAKSGMRQQMRTTLAQLLLILKNAQKRESEASLPCEKNAMLAGTILLTTAHSVFDGEDPTVSRFVRELADEMDSRTTTKTATGCVRSLLLIPKTSAAQKSISHQLLRRLALFLVQPSELEGLDISRSIAAQAIVTYVSALGPDERTAAFAIVVPVLLARSVKEGESTHFETSKRLLELASRDQQAFRAVVAKLDGEQKSFMERIIREGAGSGTKVQTNGVEDKEPTIALKMDF